MTASLRVSDFIDGIGVNVNMGGFNTAKGSAALLSALQFLGIDNIRVAASPVELASGGLGKLASQGIHFDMLMPAGIAPATTIASLSAFAAANPGAIMAIEGPNEINNWPLTYDGMTGLSAGVAFVNAAAADIAASPALAGTTLFDLTGADRSAQLAADAATDANIHPYQTNGAQPGQYLLQHVAQHMETGKGIVITEAGYQTGVDSNGWDAVDQLTQAKETLNLLVDAAALGVADTFLYDLKDYAGSSVSDNLGLFGTDLAPKPVATAIHNLTTILADTGSHAADFATTGLDYTLSGLPATGNSLLFEKSNGIHDLLVWAEPQIWNASTNSEIQAPVTPVTVGFAGAVDVQVFDPLVSSAAIATYDNVTQVTLAVTDHPLVVQIEGGTAATVSAAAVIAPPVWATGSMTQTSLIGGAGNDRLTAGPAKETIDGGLGADMLTAGSGTDRFIYTSLADSTLAASGRDQIIGFSHARADKIDLSAIDAGLLAAGGSAFHLAGSSFTGHAGELIQVASAGGILLEGDSHGNGMADFAIMFDHLAKPLVAGDFIF